MNRNFEQNRKKVRRKFTKKICLEKNTEKLEKKERTKKNLKKNMKKNGKYSEKRKKSLEKNLWSEKFYLHQNCRYPSQPNESSKYHHTLIRSHSFMLCSLRWFVACGLWLTCYEMCVHSNGWCNVSTQNELTKRGERRIFV